jgi:osmotically-inducible protein OsmY
MAREAPRKAQRSDAEIFGDARLALDRRSTVPGTVHVHVSQGTARLTGTVRRASERADAEDALRHVTGLRGILNDISVMQTVSAEGFETPDDRD